MKTPNVFGSRLKEIREIRGLTQTELSKKINIPSTSISHLESGSRKPSFDNLRKISKFFEIPTDYLIGNTESREIGAPDVLYRNIQNLNEKDREVLRSVVDSMIRSHES